MFMTSLHSPLHTLKYKGRLNNLRGRGKKRVRHYLAKTHFNDFLSTHNISSEEEERENVLSYNTGEKHRTDRCRLGVTNLTSTHASLEQRVGGVEQTALHSKGEGQQLSVPFNGR